MKENIKNAERNKRKTSNKHAKKHKTEFTFLNNEMKIRLSYKKVKTDIILPSKF